jgi:hypothetical protein
MPTATFGYNPNETGLTAHLTTLADAVVGSALTCTLRPNSQVWEFTTTAAVGTYLLTIKKDSVVLISGLALRVTSDAAVVYDGVGAALAVAENQTEHDATQAAIASLGSGVGEFLTTINVKTAANQNIPGALVTIQQSGSIVRYGYTNSSGSVVLLVNAGSYTVNISMFGFSSLVGQAITVSANSTRNYQLTAINPLPAAMPGLCNVRFEIIDGRGDPVPAAVIVVNVSSDSQTTDDKLISQAKQTVTADANGVANLVMIRGDSFTRGGTYDVVVTESNGKRVFKKLVRVPALASCSAEDLLLVSG